MFYFKQKENLLRLSFVSYFTCMHYLERLFFNRAVTFDKGIEWSQKVKVRLFSSEDLKVAVLFFLLVKIPRF